MSTRFRSAAAPRRMASSSGWTARLDQRGRAECDCQSRSGYPSGQTVPAAEGVRQRQSQHRDLRQEGRLLVHWTIGRHGRVDPATGKVDAWRSPRPGSYGITTTPNGDVWFASLAGDFIGKIDTATGGVTVVDPPRKGSGPRRIWSELEGQAVGEFLERRRRRPLRPGSEELEGLGDAEEQVRHLRGLRGRQGPGVGNRLARQRDPALRPRDREVRNVPERQARRQRAADAAAGRARPGAASRATIGWSWCGIRPRRVGTAATASPGMARPGIRRAHAVRANLAM